MTLSIRTQRIALTGILLLWCSLLIIVRVIRTDSERFTGLLWNLFLAVVPLLASSALSRAKTKNLTLAQVFSQSVWFAVWLLFLPNSPYILTDLMHLASDPVPLTTAPLWYDVALLLSCAGTGLLFGYISVIDVQSVVEQRFGKTMGWIVATASLMLCGFGIYLGRFLRWNSWEVVTKPQVLLFKTFELFSNHGTHPSPVGVTLIFGISLVLGYVALRIVAASIAPQST